MDESNKTHKKGTTEENGTTGKKDKAVEAREDVFIPRGASNDEPNLFVAVNGVSYLLPKGKTSNVPAHIAQEIRRSIQAQHVREENIDKMLSDQQKT